jgi:alpha-tubulin suppressor-like RCC1 family protein
MCYKNIIDLSYGECHYIARSINDEIYCWGNNCVGQLGNGSRNEDQLHKNNPKLNKLLSDLNINFIICGSYHSLALSQSGKVYAWGSNRFGQIGCGDNYNKLVPTKVVGLNEEKIKMISCGCNHSMALTKSGCAYIWGDNRFGQLGIENLKGAYKPKLLKLKEFLVDKITCGAYHSILLTKDGFIYAFGNNSLGQIGNGMVGKIQLIPKKLNHEKRFIDIASHWSANLSIAQSFDNIYYVWGYCKEEYILSPIETKFKSFNEILVHFNGNSLEVSEKFIEFNDLFFNDGYYERVFDEIEKIGEGSYGTVFKISFKGDINKWALKKISFKKEFKSELLREFNNFSVAQRLLPQYVVQHRNAWLQNCKTKDVITLYVWSQARQTYRS